MPQDPNHEETSIHEVTPSAASTEPLLDLSTPQGITEALFQHAVTPASMKGIPDADLESVYAIAHSQLVHGNAKEALDDLLLLVTHNPWDTRFQIAFALALQTLGEHETAARHYGQAFLMDATDAGCALRMGECLIAMGQDNEAAEAFRASIALSFLNPSFTVIREHAQRHLDQLNNS
ncbi:MAG: hypothetical protein RI942_371 [Pseudomonadota bacterium]|jgi:tetratricopeptide (TPR) repeat protein